MYDWYTGVRTDTQVNKQSISQTSMIDRCTDTDREENRCTYGETDTQDPQDSDRCPDRHMDRQTNRRTDTHIDRHQQDSDRYTDRQVDSHESNSTPAGSL